jgi:glycerophosphoryl diester phosphodiesterase
MTQLPLVQLVDASGKPYDFVVNDNPRTYADLVTPEGLANITTYAHGIGANKNLIIPRDATGALQEPTRLIAGAHAVGLLVHAQTFRNGNAFLPMSMGLNTLSDRHQGLLTCRLSKEVLP